MQRVVPEFPVALPVTVQIHTQGRKTGFPHGRGRPDRVRPVLGAGKAVQHDHQRASFRVFRFFQYRAQPDFIVLNEHDHFPFSFAFCFFNSTK